MKRMLAVVAALAGVMGTAPARADVIFDFTGPYDPSQWLVNILGDLPAGSGGSATFTPTTLTITGGDAASPNGGDDPACTGGAYGVLGPCEVDVTINLPSPFAFSFSYATGDADGPAGDIFGVIVDGVHIALSDPGGPVDQSGDRTFTATSSFGWFVNCTDCIGGAATATIGGTRFGVPEPGSLALVAIGLGGAWFARRRRSGTGTHRALPG